MGMDAGDSGRSAQHANQPSAPACSPFGRLAALHGMMEWARVTMVT